MRASRKTSRRSKSVQPEDLSATEIDVRLGPSWIPAEDIEKFCQELLGVTASTSSHSTRIGTWMVSADYYAKAHGCQHHRMGHGPRRRARTDSGRAESSHADHLRQGTEVGQARRQRGKRPKAAREKQQKIKDRFKEWIWQDDERRERLVPKIQRRIQQRSAANIQWRPSDLARRKPGRHTASAPESRRLAHPANAQHTAGSRRRRGQDIHDGCGRRWN